MIEKIEGGKYSMFRNIKIHTIQLFDITITIYETNTKYENLKSNDFYMKSFKNPKRRFFKRKINCK